jgi:exopolysaccharide biosynthesis WecB/TagA/CpsF family protein
MAKGKSAGSGAAQTVLQSQGADKPQDRGNSPDTGFHMVSFLGAQFARCSLDGAITWVKQKGKGDSFSYLVTPNVDHIVMLNEEGPEPWRAAYREAVGSSDLCVNDSRILGRLGRMSGAQLGLVPGSDLVKALITGGPCEARSIALIGGHEREAKWLRDALPGCRIAHLDPPMGVRDNADAQIAIAEFVEKEACDWVLLAIGAPQSEIVAHRIAQRGKARGAALCIGASVEFLSGAQKRAPRWMQKSGLEWLYRLLSDPGRLATRYLVRGPRVFKIWWAARGSA